MGLAQTFMDNLSSHPRLGTKASLSTPHSPSDAGSGTQPVFPGGRTQCRTTSSVQWQVLEEHGGGHCPSHWQVITVDIKREGRWLMANGRADGLVYQAFLHHGLSRHLDQCCYASM